MTSILINRSIWISILLLSVIICSAFLLPASNHSPFVVVIAAADDSKLKSKLDVSLKSPWHTSSARWPLMEFTEFLVRMGADDKDKRALLMKKYIDFVSSEKNVETEDEAWTRVKAFANDNLGNLVVKMMNLSIHLRSFLPAIERQRSDAENFVKQLNNPDLLSSSFYCRSSWVSVESNITPFISQDHVKVEEYLSSLVSSSTKSNPTHQSIADDRSKIIITTTDSNASKKIKIVLNGELGKSDFASLYKTVSNIVSKIENVEFIVRFVPSCDGSNTQQQNNPKLLGYSVSLDIKNTEYITTEDDKSKTNGTVTKLNPKQIKGLGMQIAQQVYDASTGKKKDPLDELCDTLHNFPTRASSIANVKIANKLRSQVANAPNYIEAHDGSIWINGKEFRVGHESFNIFSLIESISSEIFSLQSIENLKLPGGNSQFKSILSKISSSSSSDPTGASDDISSIKAKKKWEDVPRLNIRNGATKASISFINNVEKDQQYRSWPTSIRSLLQPSAQVVPVRKNLYTFIATLDPLDSASCEAILRALIYIIRAGVPARVGFVLTSLDLIKQQRQGKKIESSLNIDTNGDCDSKCISLFYIQAVKSQGKTAGISLLLELSKEIINRKVSIRKVAEVYTLLTSAGLSRMFGSGPSAMDDSTIKEILSDKEAFDILDKMTTYSAHLNVPVSSLSMNGYFIAAGDSITNGLPLERRITQFLFDEQVRLQRSIVANEISDNDDILTVILAQSKPSNIYSALISQSEVDQAFVPISNEILGAIPDQYYIGLGSSARNHLITLWLTLDIKSEASIQTAINILEAYSKPDTQIRFRFALLPLPLKDESIISSFEANTIVALIIRASSSLSSVKAILVSVLNVIKSSTSSTSVGECVVLDGALDHISSYIEAISESDGEIKITKRLLQEVIEQRKKSANGGNSASSSSSSIEINQALKDVNALSALLHKSFGEYEGQSILVCNGRVWPVTIKDKSSSSSQSSSPVADFELDHLLKEMKTKIVDSVLSSFKTNDLHIITSDRMVQIASTIAAYTKNTRFAIDDEIKQKFDTLVFESRSKKDTTATESSSSSSLDVSLMINPVVSSSQRVVAIAKLLRDAFDATVTMILMPPLEVSDFPLGSFFNYVGYDPLPSPSTMNGVASFFELPSQQILTLKVAVPEPWIVYTSYTGGIDIDNLIINDQDQNKKTPLEVEFTLSSLMIPGQSFDSATKEPPAGLQLELVNSILRQRHDNNKNDESSPSNQSADLVEDTMVMRNLGYFQLQTQPGTFTLRLAHGPSSDIYEFSSDSEYSKLNSLVGDAYEMVVDNFLGEYVPLPVNKRKGKERAQLLRELQLQQKNQKDDAESESGAIQSLMDKLSSWKSGDKGGLDTKGKKDEVIHIFSIASGALYERFLRIMMLSVMKRTKSKVKFWLIQNFFTPEFKRSLPKLAKYAGFEYELVYYKWPEWLRGQTEKQRLIWGNKILFLDVLFPLSVNKVIYIDADQVVKADIKELWDLDIQGHAYAYTPFCDSNKETLGFQFWRKGYWKDHLRGRPYHISALYVVDLQVFRRHGVGDTLRGIYQQLSADPNSLSNLDQDLPNYAQNSVPIFSLPQEWLWCESWCSLDSKSTAKTVDLCNNPMFKEHKLAMAKRVIDKPWFKESWIELDEEIKSVIDA